MTDTQPLQTYASLRLFGDDINPAEITRRLGVEPTYCATKGQQKVAPSGKIRVDQTGKWRVSSQQFSADSLEDHLHFLLDILDRAKVSPCDLPGVQEGNIYCFWLSPYGDGGPYFSPAVMKRLAGHGLSLGMDCYFNGSKDDSITADLPQELHVHG